MRKKTSKRTRQTAIRPTTLIEVPIDTVDPRIVAHYGTYWPAPQHDADLDSLTPNWQALLEVRYGFVVEANCPHPECVFDNARAVADAYWGVGLGYPEHIRWAWPQPASYDGATLVESRAGDSYVLVDVYWVADALGLTFPEGEHPISPAPDRVLAEH